MMVTFIAFLITVNTVFSLEFPRLPEAYSMGIEIKSNWGNRSFIFSAKEYRLANKYAFEYDTERLDAGKDLHENDRHSVRVLFDYDQNIGRTVFLTGGRKKCRRVYKISDRDRKSPGSLQLDKPAVITRHLLFAGGDDEKGVNFTFIGMVNVRNLTCQHWIRQEHDGNETVEYFFRNTSTNGDGAILVRIVESNTNFHRHSVYDYYGFKSFPPPSLEVFQPPLGTYCANYSSNMKPPRLPKKMTLSVEYQHTKMRENYPNFWLVVNSKIYMDGERLVFRTDHHVKLNNTWTPVKDVIDLKHGIQYEVFSNLDCRLSRYESEAERTWPFFKNKRHWVHAKKAIEHFNQFRMDFVHEGEREIRGVPTDVWIYQSDKLGEESFNKIEWYFTKPNVTEVSSHGIEQEKLSPVKVVGYYGNTTTKELFEMNIYDFRHEIDENDILTPTRRCLELTPAALQTIMLFIRKLPKEQMEGLHDFRQLSDVVYDIIKKAVGAGIERERFMFEPLVSQDHISVLLSIIDFPFQDESSTSKDHLPAAELAVTIATFIRNHVITFDFDANNKTYTPQFTRSVYYDRTMVLVTDEDNKDKQTITWLAIFIVVFLFAGIIGTYGTLNYILRKNGYSLKNMLRKNQSFENTTEQTSTSGDQISSVATNTAPQQSNGVINEDQETKIP